MKPTSTDATAAAAVDRRTGLLTEIEHYANPPEWPRTFSMSVGHVADTNLNGDWPADRMSTGMVFASHAAASRAAVGEALERYCANFVPAGLPQASFAQLSAAGVRAIDPRSLRLYSDEQYATEEFPFVPFTADLRVRWAAGRSMSSEAPMLAPAGIVFANFHSTVYAGEPRTNALLFAGLAAGRSRREAELAAMQEIIERDAVEIWWRAGGSACAVPEELLPGLSAALSSQTDQFEHTVLAVPNRWQVPVVAVVLFDPEYDILAVGTAARPEVLSAAYKAAAEAVSLRSYSKGLLDPAGGPWKAVELGLFGASLLKPFRSDRHYCDSFRSDFADMPDLCCNSQYYLDARAQQRVAHLRSPKETASPAVLRPVAGDVHEAYRQRLAELGHDPVSVDLTTPDVAAAGHSVVRVIAPGTYSNAAAGFPLRGGSRWCTEPQQLGLVEQPLDVTSPILPLPHT